MTLSLLLACSLFAAPQEAAQNAAFDVLPEPPLAGLESCDNLILEGERHFKRLWRITNGGENAEGYWNFAGDQLSFQRRSEEWGVSCDQIYPQPNYYIDREAADMRLIGWITWRYRLGGILYWATTLWREVRDPWADAISWKRSHCNAPAAGQGMLLYPGNLIEKYTGQENVNGPVASMRLALLREGLEELELLQLLADSGQRAKADELAAALCRGVRDFTRDPREIDALRGRLLDALAGK